MCVLFQGHAFFIITYLVNLKYIPDFIAFSRRVCTLRLHLNQNKLAVFPRPLLLCPLFRLHYHNLLLCLQGLSGMWKPENHSISGAAFLSAVGESAACCTRRQDFCTFNRFEVMIIRTALSAVSTWFGSCLCFVEVWKPLRFGNLEFWGCFASSGTVATFPF